MPGREARSSNINIRVSDTGKHLMSCLQEHYGLSQSSIMEMLLREEARRLNIVIPGSGAALKAIEKELTERALKSGGHIR